MSSRRGRGSKKRRSGDGTRKKRGSGRRKKGGRRSGTASKMATLRAQMKQGTLRASAAPADAMAGVATSMRPQPPAQGHSVQSQMPNAPPQQQGAPQTSSFLGGVFGGGKPNGLGVELSTTTGTVCFVGEFKDDQRRLGTEFNENGKKIFTGYYDCNGYRHGLGIQFSSSSNDDEDDDENGNEDDIIMRLEERRLWLHGTRLPKTQNQMLPRIDPSRLNFKELFAKEGSPFTIRSYEEKTLGRGRFGHVYRVLGSGEDEGQCYALKMYEPGELTTRLASLRLWNDIEHANLVRILGICERENRQDVLVMEECVASVESLILEAQKRRILDSEDGDDNEDGTGSVKRKLFILEQLAMALRALHNRWLVHGDLKWDNVMLFHHNSVRLGDPDGVFQDWSEIEPDVRVPLHGTQPFVAPEVYSGIVTRESDVFAFGLMMYCLLFDQVHPFVDELDGWTSPIVCSVCGEELPADETAEARLRLHVGACGFRPILTSEQIEEVGENTVALMRRCWDGNARKRPSAEEICRLLSQRLKRSSLEREQRPSSPEIEIVVVVDEEDDDDEEET